MQLQQIGFKTTETTASTAARVIPINTTSSYLCVPIPKPPHSGIKSEKFTGMDFALREKITSAMSKSEKSTRCCPASMRVAASSHTSVNTVDPQKQSISDATVASARIVARITQTDKWAKSLGKALFNVPHRHAVLTIPAALWLIVRRNRFLHKVLMDAAIAAINDTISYKHRTHRPTFQEIPRGFLRSSHKRIQNHKQTDEG